MQREATCAMPSTCCVAPRVRGEQGQLRARHVLHQHHAPLTAVRDYLMAVYPSGQFGTLPAEQVLSFFASRHWFYNLTAGRVPELTPAWAALPLVRPPRFHCADGFFGSGLVHLNMASRFPQMLPCSPGRGCVLRQAAHLPHCAPELAALGSDIWMEVWHLAFNGRMTRRPPTTWKEFGDDGASPWWYIYAPGSGIFYHAGVTLVASGKAAMLAELLERWEAAPAPLKAEMAPSLRKLLPASPEALRTLTASMRAIANGTECSRVGWGRYRCYADRIPMDAAWDEVMLSVGRALGFDSLFFTGLMWGRAFPDKQPTSAGGGSAPPLPPPPPTSNIEATTELVDLRLPPPPFPSVHRFLSARAAMREELLREWASYLVRVGRISLRDPLAPADSSRAMACNFNHSGEPTMRMACGGNHPSWGVRGETQHQQACTDRMHPGR